MSRVLETQITEDDWRRFTKGKKGVFVRKMLGFRERAPTWARSATNTKRTANSANTSTATSPN